MLRSFQMKHTDLGLTRVDALVVFASLSLLVQAALPVMQYARESSRRSACKNNLREISIGVLAHVEAHERFPSGGWGYAWIGEPERGTDIDQPGSWVFNSLHYLGEGELRDSGKGTNGKNRELALMERCATPLSLFVCPSRRSNQSWPQRGLVRPYTDRGRITRTLESAARSDYAACAGNEDKRVSFQKLGWKHPKSLEEGASDDFVWPVDPGFKDSDGNTLRFTGVIYGRSRIVPRDLRDGASNTYMLGEKSMRNQHYENGRDPGDKYNMYSGFSSDTSRSAYRNPIRDTKWGHTQSRFGSAHPSVWLAGFC